MATTPRPRSLNGKRKVLLLTQAPSVHYSKMESHKHIEKLHSTVILLHLLDSQLRTHDDLVSSEAVL